MSKKRTTKIEDDENPEWTEEDFSVARPAKEVLPEIFGKEIADEMLKPRGRPKLTYPKERINIRLSHDVITYFKSTGDGWQTRIDAALREWLKRHVQL